MLPPTPFERSGPDKGDCAPNGRTAAPPFEFSAYYRWAGYALGISLGGFFDGILLHQLLQWHHLLSGFEGGRFGGLRFQILADGAFHAAMYLIAFFGGWLLWHSRAEFGLPRADRLLISNALIGFGAWHITDGVVSHWVLGIHRIKMDADIPLVWDLVWFFLFGVAFVWCGALLRRGGANPITRLSIGPMVLAASVIGSGAVALAPPANGSTATVVVFRPGVSPAQAMAAARSVKGRLVWSDRYDAVWVIDLPDRSRASELYRKGALLVSNTMLVQGCANWLENWEGTDIRSARGSDRLR